MATSTRRRLRQSGDEAIADMRSVLGEPSPGVVTRINTKVTTTRADGSQGARRRRIVGVDTADAKRSRSRGARAATAAALKTRVVTGVSRQSIRITGAGDAFSRSYNMRVWRHPIRFNPETTTKNDVPWVSQAGRPYFGSVIGKRWPQIRQNVDAAIAEAVDAINRNGAR